MENASKALIMAGSILIGVLILALMLTLFASSRDLSNSYDERKKEEAIQQFNVNFTKYIGQDLTIHQVLTIYNFAKENGFKDNEDINMHGLQINKAQISKDLEDAKTEYDNNYSGQNGKIEVVYTMKILEYNENGYISKISFNNRHFKYTPYN